MSTSFGESGPAISRSRCRYHPERDGVGVCMKCHTVICTECSTRLDGINHCAVCVARMARRVTEEAPSGGTGWKVVVGLLLMVVLAAGGYGALVRLYLW